MYEKCNSKIIEEETVENVDFLKKCNIRDNKKVEFETEQFMLAVTSPHKRHYSSSLLAISII